MDALSDGALMSNDDKRHFFLHQRDFKEMITSAPPGNQKTAANNIHDMLLKSCFHHNQHFCTRKTAFASISSGKAKNKRGGPV
jgi:hypothetical protein